MNDATGSLLADVTGIATQNSEPDKVPLENMPKDVRCSRSATIRESNKKFACRILNHTRFDGSTRLP